MGVKCAIIGPGNIGTDLMMKILKGDGTLEMAAMVGIDPASDGLARAEKMGFKAFSNGIDGLIADPLFDDIEIIFDATSAKAQVYNDGKARAAKPGIHMIDLTPAMIGPFCVPVANIETIKTDLNVNMVTCGGQATIPIVYATSKSCDVDYAEIVASMSSKSAGPGTRANIDEFTETTSKAIQVVGGARVGKAIIILNPAEPPMLMRDTVFAYTRNGNPEQIRKDIDDVVAAVQKYVPGYELKQEVQFDEIPEDRPVNIPGIGWFHGLKVSAFIHAVPATTCPIRGQPLMTSPPSPAALRSPPT